MELKSVVHTLLSQLEDLIAQIKEEDFSKPSQTLNQATIGQHVRHILEFFLCLEEGINTGIVNYDKRAHDRILEEDKSLALAAIIQIKDLVQKQTSNYNLLLEGSYEPAGDESYSVSSNFERELIYNVEHAIHHMALIKIGVKENSPYIILPAEFGIASSTIRYLKSQQH